MSPQKRFFDNFSAIAKVGSATAPLSNRLANVPGARWVLERTLGIDQARDLPEFQRETLRKWFERRGGTAVADPDREVVLYPDLYTNHVQVERGKAAVRVLEAIGIGVRIPAVPSSGRAPLSQGMIATVEQHTTAVFETLSDQLAADRDIVVIEPSDLAMFRREYEKLLPADRYDPLYEQSYEVMEYIYGLLENGADPAPLAADQGEPIAYHSHCQQRTLGLAAYTSAILDALGHDVVTSDVECCGMVERFGYKEEYYELSMEVGSQLAEQFRTQETVDRTVVASGISCLDQLDELLERPATHPLEVIDPGPSL